MSLFSDDDLYQIAIQHLGLSKSLLAPYQSLANHDLFDLLSHKGLATEDAVLRACASFHGRLYHDLTDLIIDEAYLKTFSKALLFQHHFIPLFSDAISTYIATDRPYSPYFITDPFLSLFPGSIDFVYVSHSSFSHFFSLAPSQDSGQSLDYILTTAIQRDASDIHLFRRSDGLHIYFRVHGDLRFVSSISGSDLDLFLNQLKLHAHLDSTAPYRPHDGYLTTSYLGTTYHVRVASLPTVYGEDFVFRLFKPNADFYTFSQLGFSSVSQDFLQQLLARTSGLFLVTGPTGSGKTSTLYACLGHILSQQSCTIVTLEDPVETVIPGIRQSQISPEQGYTFASGLKAVLRQDPDCILIGEIRDRETAKVAVDAAYTGHLVLASLHTHDIPSTLHRLSSFDLDPSLVSHGLIGVLSQHLTPCVCSNCHGDRSSYCHTCYGSGTYGRSVCGELLHVTDYSTSASIFKDPTRFLSTQTRVTL